MPFKNRIFLIILVIVLAAVAAVFLAPMTVSNGVRLWVWWFARQEGFVATIEGVAAPFLHLSGRDVRYISIREFRAEVHRTNPNARTLSEGGWATLHRLLPESVNIAK